MFMAQASPIRLRNILCRRAAAIALALLTLPQMAQACQITYGALGAQICGDARLSAAWAGIDAKFAALARSHPDLSNALAEDQQLFITLLGKTLNALKAEHSAQEVTDLLLTGLQDRLAFLSSIAPAEAGCLAGAWANAGGALRITGTGEADTQIALSVSDPIMGLNTCSISGQARAQAGVLTVALPPADEASFSLMGGTALLGLDYTRAGRPAQGPERCADSAPVNGWYFRVTEGG